MILDTAGNVGIGTTSPTAKLQVESDQDTDTGWKLPSTYPKGTLSNANRTRSANPNDSTGYSSVILNKTF